MLWVINGLIYGFFMALYTLVNQRHKFNGYVLGVWRGFGIALIFVPFLLIVPLQTDWRNWSLLIVQGILIGVYDSHIFFASARYGAGVTSRLLVLSVLITTAIWWGLTPQLFVKLLYNESVFITLLLALFGFCVCYWYVMKSKITRDAFFYMIPAILALAGMSVATKEIAMMGQDVWDNILYYLVVSTFISGIYNCFLLLKQKQFNVALAMRMIFAKEVVATGIFIVGFSAALIAAKTMAMRLSPNPGYVVALLLTAPIFVYLLTRNSKASGGFTEKAGFAMLFFLILIMLLVNGNFNIVD
ncbi:MAG: hypothetical protein E7020_00610 [Alphaproteobacteria bacterium]|nr:hypothetical protein [Alphaproteobacteria bacterium]